MLAFLGNKEVYLMFILEDHPIYILGGGFKDLLFSPRKLGK